MDRGLAIGLVFCLISIAPPALADGTAALTVTPSNTYFFCGQTLDLTYTWVPDPVDTPVLRGYSVRVVAPPEVTLDQADILVHSPLVGVNDVHYVFENAPGDFTIDFTFLDPGAGLDVQADLFTLTVRNDSSDEPSVVMGTDSGRFRNLLNEVIPTDLTDTAAFLVRCVAPPRPVMVPESEFTTGLTNTVSWESLAWAGAVEYDVRMSTDPGFAVIDDESGWIPGLSHEFTGLTDGETYYYRVVARNFTQLVSLPSAIVSSTQDLLPPVTTVLPLDPQQGLPDFPVAFQADDAVSGVAEVVLFYRYEGGAWTVYDTTLTSPVDFDSPDGDGLYEFYTVGRDTAGNAEAVPAEPQASTTVDTSQPYGSFLVNGGAEATSLPNVLLVVSVIRADEMRFSNDGVTWPEGWVPLTGTHPWTLPAVEQLHTVYGEFRDAQLHVLQTTDDILLDTTPPDPVTAPAAAPGHESVLLSWTNPVDPDFARVEVWRALLHDGSGISTYPAYQGSIVPTLPADRAAAVASADWVLMGASQIGASSLVDSTVDRGVYYYEFFSLDTAGNYGDPAGVVTRSTNYILGDVFDPYDGLVRVGDLTRLGTAYETVDPDPAFDPECDVGPTDDATGTGIPIPDGQLDLEDQMIFAQNYSPSAKVAGQGAGGTDAGPILLAWRPDGDRAWTLDLVAPRPDLKGIGIHASLPAGMTAEVRPGSALTGADVPHQLLADDRNGLAAGLVVLGRGRGFPAAGPLLTVALAGSSKPPAGWKPEFRLDLRDLANRPLEFELEGKTTPVIPIGFALDDVVPNPFNPSTTVTFRTPRQERVRLEVYGVDGRRIRVLVDGVLPPGAHEAVWLGCDDDGRPVPSGVYFARLKAGPQIQVRKMTLMK